MQSICVDCGSNTGFNPCYGEMASRLGNVLASRGFSLVYGGGAVGLMGIVAEAVLRAGQPVIGVIPRSFAHKIGHHPLTELHLVDSMHIRKAMMYDLSDAFIALPGGYGTIDEMVEILTWSQLGLNGKPCGILNVNGYFDHLLAFFDHAVKEGFVKEEHRAMLLVDDSPESLLDRFSSYKLPKVDKWLSS